MASLMKLIDYSPAYPALSHPHASCNKCCLYLHRESGHTSRRSTRLGSYMLLASISRSQHEQRQLPTTQQPQPPTLPASTRPLCQPSASKGRSAEPASDTSEASESPFSDVQDELDDLVGCTQHLDKRGMR